MRSGGLRLPTIKKEFVGFQGGRVKAFLIALTIDDRVIV